MVLPETRPSKSQFQAAKKSPSERSMAGSASSAASRSWARRGLSCRFPARHGSIRIHRGIDVARAAGLSHIAGSTGSTSEAAIKALHGMPDIALIEMGDFVGGMLKYLRTHEVAKVTIAGGFAKMTKLGQGLLDLHSRRGEVDFSWLAARCAEAGASANIVAHAKTANSAREVLDLASAEGIDVGAAVAEAAWRTAAKVLHDSAIALEIAVFDRDGHLLARTPFLPVH